MQRRLEDLTVSCEEVNQAMEYEASTEILLDIKKDPRQDETENHSHGRENLQTLRGRTWKGTKETLCQNEEKCIKKVKSYIIKNG
jgi:hypothetical protein